MMFTTALTTISNRFLLIGGSRNNLRYIGDATDPDTQLVVYPTAGDPPFLPHIYYPSLQLVVYCTKGDPPFAALYITLALKSPANPPTTGDPPLPHVVDILLQLLPWSITSRTKLIFLLIYHPLPPIIYIQLQLLPWSITSRTRHKCSIKVIRSK